MKKNFLLFATVVFIIAFSCAGDPPRGLVNRIAVNSFVPPENSERFRLFDDGWKFAKNNDINAFRPDYDDHSWRILDLPHDWSIEDLPTAEGVIGPFSKNSPGEATSGDINVPAAYLFCNSGASIGYTMGGIGWYRKTFKLTKTDIGKKITLYFDGVYMESDVWVNGHHLGFHPNGYTPFYYDLTPWLNTAEQENVIAVKVKNLGVNSRWYSGSGIYRHVWLRVTDPLNIPVWGVYVTTPEATKNQATVLSEVSIDNHSGINREVVVRNTIFNQKGDKIATKEEVSSVQVLKQNKIQTTLQVTKPELWSPETPSLYTLKTELLSEGKVIDEVKTKFGIRSLHFSAKQGFLLNGNKVLLKGGCIHHDNGILGSATFNRAEQRKLEILKANGFNAVRTSHNPPSQQFLDACDRLGIMVIDEAFDMWEVPKTPNDYSRFFKDWAEKDLRSMVYRDRNHPSIIIWSFGNEIYERAEPRGVEIAKKMIGTIKSLDTTRPVTQGVCKFWEYKDRNWQETAAAFEHLDIGGYNYEWERYENEHKLYQDRIMVGTESFPNEAYENWQMVKEKPYVIGDFVWTGMDYLGEPGVGQSVLDSLVRVWPWFNAYTGDIDILGFKKPQSFYRDVVWGRSQMEMAVETPAPKGHKWVISMWGWRNEYPDWNWSGEKGKEMDVYVYSPCKEVRLELNGKLIDKKFADATSKYTFHFKVPFEPGKLTAVGLNDNREIVRKSIKTTGSPYKIRLTAERDQVFADKNDLAYLTAELVDADGNLVYDSSAMIRFEVSGEAKLIGIGNGSPTQMGSFKTDSCLTNHGRCMIILRPTGKPGSVTVKATAAQMLPGTSKVKLIE